MAQVICFAFVVSFFLEPSLAIMMRAVLSAAVVASVSGKDACCNTCEAPLEKYYSVDMPHGFCGEACMDPAKFSTYKVFESNLTKAEGDVYTDSPCFRQTTPTGLIFNKLMDTVTHGFPGLLTVTLDLYDATGMPDHSCCVTPLVGSIGCVGIPFKGRHLMLEGTGPYCCGGHGSDEEPCASTQVV